MSVITRKVVAFHIFAATIVWFALNAGSIARGADEEVRLHLTNGDRISGTIVADEEDYLVLKNDLFGQVRISKVLVGKKELLKAEIAESEQKKQRLWQTEATLGIGLTEGNTVKSSYAGDLVFSRKTDHDEFTLKHHLSENLFLRLSLIDDCNSNPEKECTQKNDFQFLTSFGYKY